MSREKIQELLGLTDDDFKPKQTNRRLTELEAKLDAFFEYQGVTVKDLGNGVLEVIKKVAEKGTESDPYNLVFPMLVKPNAFYSYQGKVYVYMGAKSKLEIKLTDDFVEADWL